MKEPITVLKQRVLFQLAVFKIEKGVTFHFRFKNQKFIYEVKVIMVPWLLFKIPSKYSFHYLQKLWELIVLITHTHNTMVIVILVTLFMILVFEDNKMRSWEFQLFFFSKALQILSYVLHLTSLTEINFAL